MGFKSYFGGVENITKLGLNGVQYQVTPLPDLIDVKILHFNKLSLITQKHVDFELFKKVVNLMSQKKHLTIQGLQQIVNIRASI